MYKTDVISKISTQTRVQRRVVGAVLAAQQQVIQEALGTGEQVQFPGFGTFYTRQRPASRLQALGDKHVVKIPAMRVAAFRVGEVLKRAVREPKRRRRLFALS
jgi:DNA-binding protein HU-beta